MAHEILYKRFEVKAHSEKEGWFEGYASTWIEEPDSYGDIVRRGAFAKTLTEWGAKDKPFIPILWNHDLSDPFSFLGVVDATKDAVEDTHGLKVAGPIDLENPKGKQVHKLLKSGAVAQMSFAFRIIKSEWVTINGMECRALLELELYEVSIVPIGANSDTSIESVKNALIEQLTAEEIAALKAIAREAIKARTESAPAEGEAEGNAPQGEAQEGKSSDHAEAVERLKSRMTAILKGEQK